MGLTDGQHEERLALAPWDYGGPEHANRVPLVAIIDGAGLIVAVEEGLGERFSIGQPPPARCRTVAVSATSPLRAAFVKERSKPAGALVRATTLGGADLTGDTSCAAWIGRRPGSLLKFLICRRYRVVHPHEMAEALWGHTGFVSSGTVRQCVYELRQKLLAGHPGAVSDPVVTGPCGYALGRSVVVDADDFAVHVRRGLAAMGRDQSEIATVHLRRAVSMYRGDFLTDEPDADWAQPERERLREHMEDAIDGLAQLYLAVGDGPSGITCLRRLAEMRPFDADVHQRLIAVLLFHGRLSHASRCYHAYEARLLREFGRTPDFTPADMTPYISELGSALPPAAARTRVAASVSSI